MKREEKHIDRVFLEKFKDFEVCPSPDVWSKIEAKLDVGKPRRIIPIWWKVAGVAASFTFLFLAWNFFQNNFTSSSSSLVNQENPEMQSNIEAAPVLISQPSTTRPISDETTEITVLENSTDRNIIDSQPISTIKRFQAEISLANSPTKSYITNTVEEIRSKDNTSKIEETIAAIDDSETSISSAQNNFNSILTSLKNNLITNSIAVDQAAAKDISISTYMGSLSAEKKAREELLAENSLLSTQLTSIEMAQETNENLDNKQKRLWSLKPQFSPIFNLATNSGSTVDPMLSNNSSQGNTSLAYGMLVTYTLANNLRLRSGVQQVNVSYTTNDVIFAPAVAGVAFNQINFNASAAGFNVFNEAIYEASLTNPNARAFAVSGDLQQQLGFVEIPLEVEWQLFEGKFGIYASGGASTLFLIQNTVGFRNEMDYLNIGENTAVNTASLSGNLGIGLEYQLSRRLNLNLEPSFRYQLNTFSSQVDGFYPYFFAIYSGINLKF